MTTFRVDIDGKTVWSDDFDGTYEEAGGSKHFGEYLTRPADTPDGEAHPSPVYLHVDDVLVGIQRAHGDEAEQCETAAAWLYAAAIDPNHPDANEQGRHDANAAAMKLAAFDASIHAADALGDAPAAAARRFGRAKYQYELDTAALGGALAATPDPDTTPLEG